jgi:hypothetical protein
MSETNFGGLADMELMLESILHSVMPDAEGLYDLSVVNDQHTGKSLIIVEITLRDDKIMGLCLGKKMRNVLMILSWVRGQQIHPLAKNAKILMSVARPSGKVRRFEFCNETSSLKRPSWLRDKSND